MHVPATEAARYAHTDFASGAALRNALERLIFHARHSDLVVVGRARQRQGLAPETLEQLVMPRPPHRH